METNNKDIFNVDYLDIIYKGKNKAYGGYQLRKKYTNRVILGAILTISIVGGILASTMINLPEPALPPPPVIDKTVTMAEPPPLKENQPPPPPPPVAPPPVKPTVKFTPPVIKPNEEVTKEDKPEVPKPEENKVVGPETRAGSDDPFAVDPGLSIGGDGDGKPQPPVVEEPPKKQEPLRSVQKLPKFPGSVEQFFKDNIRYPALAEEQGIEGTVVLEFVVGADGKVSNIVVRRPQPGGLTEEAIRVAKMMPRWEPGEQNGKPVPVYHTQAIKFQLTK